MFYIDHRFFFKQQFYYNKPNLILKQVQWEKKLFDSTFILVYKWTFPQFYEISFGFLSKFKFVYYGPFQLYDGEIFMFDCFNPDNYSNTIAVVVIIQTFYDGNCEPCFNKFVDVI
jgi:hypothetical protein